MGLFSLGANFPYGQPLALIKLFKALEIYNPTAENSHVSDTLFKVYMDSTIICHTHAMSTIILLAAAIVVNMFLAW